jgi:hypothetical protein
VYRNDLVYAAGALLWKMLGASVYGIDAYLVATEMQ